MPESFASFMARALHDPQRGYYARRIQGIGGQRGDFATAATLSPLLGQAIAAWLKQSRREMPEVGHVIEVGAGNGVLMETVRKSLGWWSRRALRWHIVETSEALREQQRQRLGSGVTWHSQLETALAACSGAAFIYHNELLDAFPVRLVQCQEGEWLEVFVEFENGRVRELLRPLEMKPGFSALAHPPQHPRQRCELHESVRDWLRGWVPGWKRGVMLSVDYGDLFPALYHRRPFGTLRAYLLQQRLEGLSIYENVGRQDITADINFTDYRAWAAQLGLEEIGYGEQAEFLQSRVPGASGSMLDSEGAGGAFKVVIHRRG
jgi:SAM-dependent MidA family methyltransferase